MSPVLIARDNMGYAIPPIAIVLVCMLGSGVLLVILYGMFRYYGPVNDNEGFRPMSEEQMSYIKEVRDQNLKDIAQESRRGLHAGKGRAYGR
ncbi:hypothetical protein P280DRAFT_518683 [Massarina eburnea CBS 473.64]|uniref:Uncharacterized protein n=1 Tax=Massarina eburnea CBS 473.64 TaxID=1395130 RepID=A0A6A6RYT7_9PLEO|nr:hypothetical protein P280DRAFT_518683 [Massarina eburnea CBS 473.64]